MKNIIIILFSLFFSTSLMGQLDSFDISDYALPDLDYKRMNANFSLSSYGSSDRSESPFLDTDNDGYSLSASAGLNTYRYINSEKKQLIRRFSTSIYPNYRFDRSERDQTEHSRDWNYRFPLYMSSDAQYRLYHAPKRFIEYGSYLWMNTAHQKAYFDDVNGSRTETYTDLRMDFSPGILYGFGRVENVSHSWHAVRILKDLEQFGLLENVPNRENILGLADLLAQRVWTRSFDYRIKYMEDFEMLANYLKANSLHTQSSPRFYASLNDMFLHGINATRYAGEIFAFGLATHFNPNVSSRESFFNFIQYGAGLEVKYERFKPVNQELQFDVKVSFKSLAIFTHSPEDGFVAEGVKPVFTGDIDFGFGWYPNTRTSFNSGLVIRGSNKLLLPFILYHDTNELNASIRWENNLQYYISPRAYINANLETSYSYFMRDLDNDLFTGNDRRRRFNHGFDIGFGYAIY